MRYRVTQFDSCNDRIVQSKTYRFWVVAFIMGWLVAGPGPGGMEYYSTVTKELA